MPLNEDERTTLELKLLELEDTNPRAVVPYTEAVTKIIRDLGLETTAANEFVQNFVQQRRDEASERSPRRPSKTRPGIGAGSTVSTLPDHPTVASSVIEGGDYQEHQNKAREIGAKQLKRVYSTPGIEFVTKPIEIPQNYRKRAECLATFAKRSVPPALRRMNRQITATDHGILALMDSFFVMYCGNKDIINEHWDSLSANNKTKSEKADSVVGSHDQGAIDNAEYGRMRSRFEQAEQEIRNLKSKIGNSVIEKESAETVIAERDSDIDGYLKQIEGLKVGLNEAQKRVAELESEKTEAKSSLEDARLKFAADLEEKDAKIGELADSLKGKNAELAKQTTDLIGKDDEIRKLKKDNNDIRATSQQVAIPSVNQVVDALSQTPDYRSNLWARLQADNGFERLARSHYLQSQEFRPEVLAQHKADTTARRSAFSRAAAAARAQRRANQTAPPVPTPEEIAMAQLNQNWTSAKQNGNEHQIEIARVARAKARHNLRRFP